MLRPTMFNRYPQHPTLFGGNTGGIWTPLRGDTPNAIKRRNLP